MKKPEDDVQLTNGSGYVVEQTTYKEHLKTAIEIKEVVLSDFSKIYT
jgi:hypothetical protein